MKKKNSVCEFKDQRSRLLLENFRASLARQSEISAKKAFGEAVAAPAPRFWVSEARAAAVIGKMIAGQDPTASMFPEKARMFQEIFRRVEILRKKEPDATVGDLVFRVVNSPAPCSYLTPLHARRLVAEAKKKK